MDTSETYIKQCEKAEEIQAQWKAAMGDWFAYWFDNAEFTDTPHWAILVIQRFPRFANREGGIRIWLPRQDQLQEIVASIESPARVVWCVGCWCNHNKYAESFTSMEQLWLAFVMWEKHGKKWDGEKWQLNGTRKSVLMPS